ncbi:EH signature domain-containing protein [Vibrio minamisatsumaniensis]|uniref:EH signature domain-containing protein n=1 Tax=Vibrio minamisatsumaniensis TaxID=2910243 RepID=UPI003D1FB150
MTSSGFSFSQPELPKRISLLDQPQSLVEQRLVDMPLPSFPAKGLLEIVELVQQERYQDIHIFEWLDILQDESQWVELDQATLSNVLPSVWKGITASQKLSEIIFFKIALALDGKKSEIVPGIINSLEVVKNHTQMLSRHDAIKARWLLALQNSDLATLARYCYESGCTAEDMLTNYQLPLSNGYSYHISEFLFGCLDVANLNKQDDQWLASYFYSYKVSAHRMDFCRSLILEVGHYNYGESCHQIIEAHCLPFSKNSYWNKLPHDAKVILKQKYDLTCYYDLHTISSILYSNETSEALGLTEYELVQIKDRSLFWSNYSSRFSRVRVLLPVQTHDYLAHNDVELPDFIHRFSEEKQSNVETYVFELDGVIAVEFLRGETTDTRFFKKTSINVQQLFDSTSISVDAIRAMSQLEVHDHLDYWQHFCEKLLREKLSVLPNSGTTQFRGLAVDLGRYWDDFGLAKLTSDMLSIRKKAMQAWIEKFWEAEYATGKFGEIRGLAKRSQVYHMQALEAEQLGHKEDYEHLIRKAANQGNPDAMYRTGISVLKTSRSDRKLKQSGEDWIVKAANLGHIAAREFVKKFRLSGFAPKPASHDKSKEKETPLNQPLSLREKADKGDVLAMCLYGNSLILSGREFDKHKGLEYLTKAANQDPTECHPKLWEAYELALNSNSIDMACEILKLLVQVGDNSALVELGKLRVQDVTVDISEGLALLWQAYEQGSWEAKTVLWETVEKTRHKDAELNYKTTLHYLSGIGELEATYLLAAHLLKSNDVGDRQSGMDLMRSAARNGHDKASKLLR